VPTNVFQFLFDLFDDEEARTEQASQLPEDITGADILSAIPQVCAALPPEQAAFVASAYGIPYEGPGGSGGSGPAPVDLPPPPAPQPGESDADFAQRQINYFTEVVNVTHQTFNDGDNVINQEGDSLVNNSVNTNIEAFGDVDFEQDIDNENNLALGEDSIAQSGSGTANTGDDAFVVGDDLNNSGTIATGPVGGSVTGDIEDSTVVGRDVGDGNVLGSEVNDSIVGNDNQAVIDSEIDESALAFGGGDATSINDSQVLEGDGTIQNVGPGGNANAAVNTGSGDQAVAQQSTLDESNVGSGSNESNDIDIDDSNVAFGGGDAGDTDVDIDDVDGNVQVATGDDNTQTALNDESFNAEDSFNTDNSVDVEDSFNIEDNLVADDSFNPTEVDIDDSGNVVDNDVLDVN
jgi:hypothetical protein